MVKSLVSYLKNFLSIAASGPQRALLLEEAGRFRSKKFLSAQYSFEEKKEAVQKAVKWMLYAQEQMEDDGIGSYHLVKGWTSSYPETTGYIIPTLIEFANRNNQDKVKNKALEAADWLLTVQKPSGGWPGMRLTDNKPETVFNTAQALRGLMAAYNETGEKKYLQASVRATDWLCENQDDQGFWRKFAYLGAERVYDSYVDAPILQMYEITGKEEYRLCAQRNLYWIIEKKQLENGWFEDCDNTIKHNNRPILHTIAYTIDGLLDSSLILKDNNLQEAAKKPADVLLKKFLKDGYLNGRFDRYWNGSEFMICTGCAQISIVWSKLYKIYKDERYKAGAQQMNNLLIAVQSRGQGMRNTEGAISGSFPLWGKYEPFAFPNWATKYFVDALLLELETNEMEK